LLIVETLRRKEGMNRRYAGDFQSIGTILSDTVLVDTCHFALVRSVSMHHTHVNYGL
jgi:hypothetical protein